MNHEYRCQLSRLDPLSVAILGGLITGLCAGLIGVGGGEFRLPLLIAVLKIPTLAAISINLIIGLVVSIVSFACRMSMLNTHTLTQALILGGSALIGGYAGAFITGKISERIVSYILLIFLAIIGLKYTIAPLINFHFPIALSELGLDSCSQYLLLIAIGFATGILSGIFGVAGGEVRIPLLMMLLGIPIKLAGTINTLAAIPAQFGGLIKHYKLKHLPKSRILLALYMTVASIIGSFIGAHLVFVINETALEVLLGLILLGATIGIYLGRNSHKHL